MYTHYVPGQVYRCNHDVNPFTETELCLLIQLIKSMNPDVIGLSTRTFWLEIGDRIIRSIRESLPQSLVIAGGYGPSLRLAELAKQFDFVCFGEGERALLQIARCIDQGNPDCIKDINNIAYLSSEGKLVINDLDKPITNLNELPFPDWDDHCSTYIEENSTITDPGRIRKTNWYDLFASRGCSSSCTYCMAGQWNRLYKEYGGISFPKVRSRSPENVIEELLSHKEKYDLKYVRFLDSIFSSSEGWLTRFLELYRSEINLPFFCNVEIRFQSMNLLRKLCERGMTETSFGIQSGSYKVRREIFNRKISNDSIIEAATFLSEKKVNYQQDLIGFNPFDTEETLCETFDLLCKLPPKRTVVFQLKIFPASSLEGIYNKVRPSGLTYEHHHIWTYMWHLASSGEEYRELAMKIRKDCNGRTPLSYQERLRDIWLGLNNAQNRSLFQHRL